MNVVGPKEETVHMVAGCMTRRENKHCNLESLNDYQTSFYVHAIGQERALQGTIFSLP